MLVLSCHVENLQSQLNSKFLKIKILLTHKIKWKMFNSFAWKFLSRNFELEMYVFE